MHPELRLIEIAEKRLTFWCRLNPVATRPAEPGDPRKRDQAKPNRSRAKAKLRSTLASSAAIC
jgi:hypothetical protein